VVSTAIAVKDEGTVKLTTRLREIGIAKPMQGMRQTMSKLANKVAVVTGASKGIGASIAQHLAAEGASVVMNYSTSKEGAEKVVKAIVSAGGKAVAVAAYLTHEAEVRALFDATKQQYGRVDILVNNAGHYTFARSEGITSEPYHRLYDTNVLALLLVTKAALDLFPVSGGSVINIGSAVSALTPQWLPCTLAPGPLSMRSHERLRRNSRHTTYGSTASTQA